MTQLNNVFSPQVPAEIVKEIDELGGNNPDLESGVVSEFCFPHESRVPSHLL